MKPKEILDKIENLIENKLSQSNKVKTELEEISNNRIIKDLFLLITQFFLSIIKSPFKTISMFLKNEIIIAMKKDGKLYALIFGIMITLFVFLSILWLFISIAVGAYFFERGHSIFSSTMYSIGFQFICILTISIIALFATKGLKSFKLFKRISNYKKMN